MRIDFGLAAALAVLLCVSCKSADEKKGDAQRPGTTAKKEADEKTAGGVAPVVKELKPVFNVLPVPAEKLESMEVVLAESEKAGTEDEIRVFVILYDESQNMSAADGKLELAYSIEGGERETKVKDVEVAMFRKQVIPGEEEPSLTYLADIITVTPGQTLQVTAAFADLLEADDSITMADAETIPAPEAPPEPSAVE